MWLVSATFILSHLNPLIQFSISIMALLKLLLAAYTTSYIDYLYVWSWIIRNAINMPQTQIGLDHAYQKHGMQIREFTKDYNFLP